MFIICHCYLSKTSRVTASDKQTPGIALIFGNFLIKLDVNDSLQSSAFSVEVDWQRNFMIGFQKHS